MNDLTNTKTFSNKSDKILVAYFSWSGNTRDIANQIQKVTGGDIFEIQEVDSYSKNYNEVLARAKQEIRSGEMPELKERLATIEKYDIIFIGYPNWWNTFPAPVLTFLNEYDFKGKTIIPFCTHGGGGAGRSFREIAKQFPGANVLDGFSINGYSVNGNNNEVINWINNINKSRIN